MNTTISPHRSEANTSGLVETLMPVNVVLVYDDDLAANAARRQVLPIITRTVHDLDFHREEWSFQDLANVRFGQEAIEGAADCDLIIVATVWSAYLRPPIRVWLNQWLDGRRQKDTALVSLAGSRDCTMLDSPVQSYLCWLARSHGLAFFTSTFELPKSIPLLSYEDRIRTCSPRPERHGLNE